MSPEYHVYWSAPQTEPAGTVYLTPNLPEALDYLVEQYPKIRLDEKLVLEREDNINGRLIKTELLVAKKDFSLSMPSDDKDYEAVANKLQRM